MTLSTTKTTGDDVSPAEWNEAATAANKVTDQTLTAADITDVETSASDRDRANHTGTQTASTISDFDAEVSNNTDVAANTGARHTQGTDTTLGAMTDDINMNNNDVTNIKLAEFNEIVDNGSSGTADTIDWGTGNFQVSTLTDNVTYTFTAPSGVSRLTLFIVQDATGSRTVTWPGTVEWAGGSAPTLTGTANSIDAVTFVWTGTVYYGTFSGDFQ